MRALRGRIGRLLRATPILAEAHAGVRAWQTRSDYRDLVRRYAGRPDTLPALPACELDHPPRVLFIGTDEEQDRSGFIQALERCSQLTLFRHESGRYGHNDPRAPEVRRAANARQLDATLDAMAAAGGLPQIVIAQTWATLIDPAAFDRARARGCMVINIAMDDRHQFRGRRESCGWSGTLALIGHIDLALTAAPECVAWYQAEGCPALYFPEASDPDIFHPRPELPRIHDVSFIGGRYGIREQIVRTLRRAGVKVSAWGNGWEGGRIDVPGMARVFAQSRVILGVGTIGHCRDFYALKLRDFDAPMTGSCYLTHDNPDLRSLYDVGREIVTYRSTDDCVDQVRALLADPARAESIGQAGRIRAQRDHTWARRFSDLFSRMSRPATPVPTREVAAP
jgi:spore maturation protein CgeB